MHHQSAVQGYVDPVLHMLPGLAAVICFPDGPVEADHPTFVRTGEIGTLRIKAVRQVVGAIPGNTTVSAQQHRTELTAHNAMLLVNELYRGQIEVFIE